MAVDYRQLEGMRFEFVSGAVVKEPVHMLTCTITFMALLDFTHFKHMSNVLVPGYLASQQNAIRPVLEGVAHHRNYNRFGSAAGKIDTVEALSKVFSSPDNYFNIWAGIGDGIGLQMRYHTPQFDMVGGHLQVTGGQDFRWEDEREIKPQDVPDIHFTWTLNVLKAHPDDPFHQPEEIVRFGYSEQAFVEVGGRLIRKGTHYMVGRELRLGAINPKQILTAG
ncbi:MULTISPECIES: hypothetical protein [Gammaproteobacteria]|uniref:hypothetical protein n=1 Tax=Gammaproteobacteria TaxID=1236 RepID=UPI001913D03E|nr:MULTISPECIES: hypothetical protein [Gammaproteobacteria]MBK5299909.1 hypothetical protein [Bacillus sp. TH86]MBK5319678.1 hypothetical protein [Bacillus sp. TH59]MBK5334628.1 hypothetical protein [Bacillus sp. TH57]MBK5308717.1 hypothetical protein [Pseudomonas sp. TH71]MBK5314177.1 hypothetical protein [Erwinia sp. TH79]